MIGDFTQRVIARFEQKLLEHAQKCGDGIADERLYREMVGRRKGLKEAIVLINEEADLWLREQDE